MDVRRKRYWESFTQMAMLPPAGTLSARVDTGLMVRGRAHGGRPRRGKHAMNIRHDAADR